MTQLLHNGGVGATALTAPVTPTPMSTTKVVIGVAAAAAVVVGLFYLFPSKPARRVARRNPISKRNPMREYNVYYYYPGHEGGRQQKVVVTARNGKAAKARVKRMRPDVVIAEVIER
jgi:hypothetical protein